MRRLLQHWTESSIILTSKEGSVWRNKKKNKKRTVAFAEDRLLTWFTSTSGSPEPMIPSRTMPTYLLLLFEIHLMASWKDCTNKEYESEKLKDRIGIAWPGDSSEESRTWLSQIEDDGEKKYRARFTKQEFLGSDMENYERNAVVKNQGTKQRGQRIVGDCWQWETNGPCSKGDNCSFRHDVFKRAKMTVESVSELFHAAESEKCVENPKSQRQESQWKNVSMAMQGLTSKELAPIHSVNSGTLPECLFYKTKSGCRFGEKCSYAHRQVDNNLVKGQKRMTTKVQ